MTVKAMIASTRKLPAGSRRRKVSISLAVAAVSGEARRDQSRQTVSALVLGSLAAAVLGCGLVTAPAASAASAYSGAEIVARAASQAGVPYCWDGGNQSGPTHGSGNVEGATDCGPGVVGFDCTGLTMYATGLPLAHDSAQATDAVNNFGGQRIYSKSELQPGDIVYFGGSFGGFDHAGVYAGGGMMWDADIAYWIYPDGVHERTLASIENALPFVGGVRLSHEGGPPPPPSETVSNLLSDGGFQGGGVGWQALNPPGGGVTNHVVYENGSLAREGTHYMEANTSTNGGSIFQDTSVNLPAEASATASVWARVNPGQPLSGQTVVLCVWDLNSLTNACKNLELTHQWQQVQVTTTMPGAATDLRTQVYMNGEGNMDFDGAVLGAPQTAEAVYVPSNESPPVISGSTSVSSMLACAPGVWSDAPTALSYSWSLDGTPIAGADDNTYTITTADEGHALTCLVTASNAAGEATAASAPTSVPAPTSPASTPAGTSTSSFGTVPADVSKGGVDAIKTGVTPPRLSSEQLLVKRLAACRRNKNLKKRTACRSAARRRYQHELKLARQRRLDRALAACKQIRSQSKQRECVSIAEHRYG